MVKHSRTRSKVVFLVLAAIILYNEYISYSLQKWFIWPRFYCDSSSKCLKMLLVADPQILGEQYESNFPKGVLSRWDSDRYLTKTFHKAVSHLRPDVIVFLGDIMDEGSIAKDDEYDRYLSRFYNIFHPDPRYKFLFLPGDNDIGGEDQPLTLSKMKRFQETFNQPDLIQLDGVDLFKVNRLAYAVPLPEEHGVRLLNNRTRIVLTHLPLLFLPSGFVQQVSTQLRPHVIFSAHDHKSLHIMADVNTGEERLAEMLPPSGAILHHFPLNSGLLHEIMVPTCSYRMGVSDMGYGAAMIDVNTQIMTYGVLWLPRRFPQLLAYLVTLVMLASVFLLLFLCHLCGKLRHGIRKTYVSKHIV